MKLAQATDVQVIDFINSTNDWEVLENKLHKVFIFSDFTQAFAFMTSIARYAEKNNHHPEWFNVYKTVKVDLTTHDVSGISDRDFSLAKEMDTVAREIS